MFTRLLVLATLFVPATAHAQAGPLPPAWDISATAGLFSGYRPRIDGGRGYQDPWLHSIQAGLIGGRYVTRHLKFELEASTTTGGTHIREQLVEVPGSPYPYPVASQVTTSVMSVGAALVWQFRDNEWVHPFAYAGVSGDFDRITTRTWDYANYGSSTAPPRRTPQERVEGPFTEQSLRGVLGGGGKIYMSTRAFIRVEGRWSFEHRRQNVALRAGFGFDF